MTIKGRSVLRGELNVFGLGSLLTMLEMERGSGVLMLQQMTSLGRVSVRGGRVIRAQMDGERKLQGAAAVYELLDWTEGQFELLHVDVTGPDEIRASSALLMMEGARRADEKRASQQQAGVGTADFAV